MASANGFRNTLPDQAPVQRILPFARQPPPFQYLAAAAKRAVTWSASPSRSVLRYSNLGSFGQTGQPPRRKPVAATKKPGAVSRPGMIA
jgi:hypothetical protein